MAAVERGGSVRRDPKGAKLFDEEGERIRGKEDKEAAELALARGRTAVGRGPEMRAAPASSCPALCNTNSRSASSATPTHAIAAAASAFSPLVSPFHRSSSNPRDH